MLTKNKLLQENKIIHDVLNCEAKDCNGLNDFQQLQSQDQIAIPHVGISRYRHPIIIQYPDGTLRTHDAETTMNVDLSPLKTGINMSRLCRILQDETEHTPLTKDQLKKIVEKIRLELRDNPDEALLHQAEVKTSFFYADKQPSLKSGLWGWQYYPVTLRGKWNDGQFQFSMELTYEYSSTCPCSLSMAKQYERDFVEGKTTEGTGVAVAHGQRSELKATVLLKDHVTFSIHDLIELLREAIPTETQSMVKRPDEQAFAILNGSYPMFVEHASRSLSKTLNKAQDIKDWMVTLSHFESLHSHNAMAKIAKENGTYSKILSYL